MNDELVLHLKTIIISVISSILGGLFIAYMDFEFMLTFIIIFIIIILGIIIGVKIINGTRMRRLRSYCELLIELNQEQQSAFEYNADDIEEALETSMNNLFRMLRKKQIIDVNTGVIFLIDEHDPNWLVTWKSFNKDKSQKRFHIGQHLAEDKEQVAPGVSGLHTLKESLK